MIPRHCIFAALALWLSMALPAGAQGLPAIKTEQPAQAKALVGQRVVFHIDLQAKGEFSGSPRFVLPDVAGILLMQSEDHPVLSSMTVGEDSYVIERFDFIVFAKQAGPVTIPPIQVSFGSITAVGQPVTTYSGETDAISLQVGLPPGAAAAAPMPIVSSHFEVTQSWQPQPHGASAACKIGDAFRRTITLKAQDGLSMLLPPLKMPVIGGLKTYLAAPQLADRSERGDARATRIETVTYICVSPGQSLIPAISYRWWSIDTGSWESVALPAVRLAVNAAGATGNGTATGRHARSQWLASASGAVILLLAMLFIWGWRRHQPLSDGVESRFNRLLIACGGSDPAAAYNAYVNWRLVPSGNLRSGLPVDDLTVDIKRDLQHLQECLLSGMPWDGRQLTQSLKAWHRAARQVHAGKRLLPQLN